MRTILLLLLSAFLAAPAWAQDADDETAEATTADVADTEAEEESEEAEEAPEFDESGLDEQGFSNEDGDFDPSEDIPADQSIEFPADI